MLGPASAARADVPTNLAQLRGFTLTSRGSTSKPLLSQHRPLDSLLTHDGGAVHSTSAVLVIRYDSMHDALVVPDHEVAFAPLISIRECG